MKRRGRLVPKTGVGSVFSGVDKAKTRPSFEALRTGRFSALKRRLLRVVFFYFLSEPGRSGAARVAENDAL